MLVYEEYKESVKTLRRHEERKRTRAAAAVNPFVSITFRKIFCTSLKRQCQKAPNRGRETYELVWT